MAEAGLEPPQTLAQSQLHLPISVKINDGASTSWQEGVCSSPTSVSTSSVPINPISTKPRVEKRQISTHEHSYVKQRKVSVEDTYVETIDILKNMDTKLESINQKLGSIADSLKIIAEKM
ncbi:uncharacterized protein LOC126881658 [Diabrotica virgifera virgifera]|uniref:Uncharacterized protein n=1 Tax=Diabrotica virgifera virgifera TaxID=50390 RepID=A0ABM5JVN4_DIAVI|nr:uncharacterized protein LOC126878858 [Diabrotica virgifera virgifera]XP_050501994.1 uncharacterized protein LOC126881658 [Diabrotica virgifera virgifera]